MTTDNSKDLLPMIIEGIQERKGKNITVVDLSSIESAAASRFVICEGTSTQHVAAVADSIRECIFDKSRIKPYNYDGYGNSQWIVIDYDDTLVHIFVPEMRRLYDLEGLWSDASITDVPDLD
ncbi:ribosome silencing factor [Duncaniella freteri]|uniref:ribosome silencing factor n=1 Tax=Duncaniella freteri TaxID=2530391 RepID=UPI0025550C28|nr:ribosome silencing factor [Duncaniella freteri]